MRRTNKLLRSLKGWGFDIPALQKSERGRAFLSSSNEVSTRSFDKPSSNPTKEKYQWDHYSGLPGTGAYMDRS